VDIDDHEVGAGELPGIVPDGHNRHKSYAHATVRDRPSRLKLQPLAARETPRNFITVGEDADLQKAMDVASMDRLDAYSLASLTMDCRLGNPTADVQRVQCFVAKSLGVKKN
jgi:hypothetical protein